MSDYLKKRSQSTQVNFISDELRDTQYRVRILSRKLESANKRIKQLEEEKNKNSKILNSVNQILADAEQLNGKAVFLKDVISSYGSKKLRWSKMSVKVSTENYK